MTVPGLRRLPTGSKLTIFHSDESALGIDEYEVATQGVTSHHLREVDGIVERTSIPFRYVWPSELDLMAELAGMRSRNRYANWHRDPFDNESTEHVSVWVKPNSQGSQPARK